MPRQKSGGGGEGGRAGEGVCRRGRSRGSGGQGRPADRPGEGGEERRGRSGGSAKGGAPNSRRGKKARPRSAPPHEPPRLEPSPSCSAPVGDSRRPGGASPQPTGHRGTQQKPLRRSTPATWPPARGAPEIRGHFRFRPHEKCPSCPLGGPPRRPPSLQHLGSTSTEAASVPPILDPSPFLPTCWPAHLQSPAPKPLPHWQHSSPTHPIHCPSSVHLPCLPILGGLSCTCLLPSAHLKKFCNLTISLFLFPSKDSFARASFRSPDTFLQLPTPKD